MIKKVLLLFLFPCYLMANESLWQPIPLVTSAQKTNSNPGGEGAQQIQCLGIDGSSGTTIFVGTDVGGGYVSYNGGAFYQPTNIGITSSGLGSCAIDPNNSNFMLAAGCNSGSTAFAGLYLTTNGAQNWSQPLTLTSTNVDLYNDEIAYDPSSLSGGKSVTVYYLTDAGASVHGLEKSTNGGTTWSLINSTSAACTQGGIIKVAPTGGDVYIANSVGFWVSSNGGSTFSETVTIGTLTGLDVTAAAPSNVYISESTTGVLKSTTNGSALSFTLLTGTGLLLTGGGIFNIKVNPVSATDMMVVTQKGSGNDVTYYSFNSGTNWTASVQNTSASFLPAFQRDGTILESPANTYTAWTNTCGDAVYSTVNGGATFSFNNNGYVGATCGSIYNFTAGNPLSLFIATQDYNSAYSGNGLVDWTWFNVSGNSFGFNYGGYAFNSTNMFVGNTGAAQGSDPMTLTTTTNGGTTWNPVSGVTLAASASIFNVVCGDPGSPTNNAFWNKYWTHDTGAHWQTVGSSGVTVQGVFTYNPATNALIGIAGSNALTIVTAPNATGTWSKAATETLGDGYIIDVAYDWQNNIYYAATNEGALIQWVNGGAPSAITSKLPTDQQSNQNVDTVCIDPVNPNIVYAGYYTGLYTTSQPIAVSFDAGKTFRTLAMQSGDNGIDGGTGPVCLRVNPITRQLVAGGGVYGVWGNPVAVAYQNLFNQIPRSR